MIVWGRIGILILCSAFVHILSAQKILYPTLPKTAPLWRAYIPSGWEIKDSAWGDLNKDTAKDLVVLIESKDSFLRVDTLGDDLDSFYIHANMLNIIFYDKKNKLFVLNNQCNGLIPPFKDHHSLANWGFYEEDPYLSMEISVGILQIRCWEKRMQFKAEQTRTYIFRYQAKKFYLIGAEYFGHSGGYDYYNYSINFLTRYYEYYEINFETDKRSNQSRKKFKLNGLKPIESFTTFFTWKALGGLWL